MEREVTFAAVSRGVSKEEALRRAGEALDALGLARLIADGRRTWELSAGERRLVLLASALIAPAGWLALDEPTAGLDSARRARLAALVEARARTTPVLVASQDPVWTGQLGAKVVSLGDP